MDLSRLYKSHAGTACGLHPPPPSPDICSVSSQHPLVMKGNTSTPDLPTLADTPTNHDRCIDQPENTPSSSRHDSAETCDCGEEPQNGTPERTISRPQRGDRSVLEKWNPALTLENSGSVARDHLASERTFLAYVRTSLTIASTGVGECYQFIRFEKFVYLTRV